MEVRPPDRPKRSLWEALRRRLAALTGRLEDRPPNGDFTKPTAMRIPSSPQATAPRLQEEEPPEEATDVEDDGDLPGMIDRTPRPPPQRRRRPRTRPFPPPPVESYVEPETTTGVPAHRPADPPGGTTGMDEPCDFSRESPRKDGGASSHSAPGRRTRG